MKRAHLYEHCIPFWPEVKGRFNGSNSIRVA